MQKPSIGRIVHFVTSSTDGTNYFDACLPAIITEIHKDGCVGLAIFSSHGMTFFTSEHDEITQKQTTWHWPEIVMVTPDETA